jgi:hypothetical protein
LTKPLGEEGRPFEKVAYPEVDLGRFIEVDDVLGK